MHRVVDAMDVVGSRPDGWWHDPARAIERLVGQVDRRVEHGQERVTVMLEHGPREEIRPEQVEIAWASADAADPRDPRATPRLVGRGRGRDRHLRP